MMKVGKPMKANYESGIGDWHLAHLSDYSVSYQARRKRTARNQWIVG